MIKNYKYKIFIYFNMEEIKHRISERNYNFLQKLQEYIGSELIFFGSIKRCDFIPKYSDIDIAIITDNIQDTIVKLKNFLDIDNRKMRKIFQKFSNNNTIVYGYKTNYDDTDNNLSLEIVLYDIKYKKQVLNSIYSINNFPFYITYTLLIIKILFYNLNIISKDVFDFIKKTMIKKYLNQTDDNLIAIKI